MVERINRLIKEIQRDPFAGIGKPEALKHATHGSFGGVDEEKFKTLRCARFAQRRRINPYFSLCFFFPFPDPPDFSYFYSLRRYNTIHNSIFFAINIYF